MTKPERCLRWVLRILGGASLTALFFVAVPYAWMNAIHQGLGLGTLPDAPVVGYLARSTSAFYALLGGLLWVLSLDVRRHRLALCYLGAAITSLGLILWGVDLVEGLPLFWCLWEGPLDTLFGLAILWLSYRVGQEDEEKAGRSAEPNA
jgi:hypothetical protein